MLLVAALGLIIKKTYQFSEVNGEWDAWAIWNLHASYLTDPEHWQRMFLNIKNGHPDYPLGLPAFLAFFIRLCNGNGAELIPFILSFFITIVIPLFIYSEVLKKNIVIAGAALFLFVQDDYYLNRGVAQYADTLLGLFFLCAVACIYRAKENKRYILLSAFFAGAGMWVKNEGIVLAAIFILFNFDTFLAPKNLKFFFAGFILPAITVAVYKVRYSTGNDMVGNQGSNTINYLKNKSRYDMIYSWFKTNLNTNFYYIKIGVFIYGLLSLLQKKFPDRQMLMLLTCLGVFMAFYLVTPNDLEWHLSTSQDRLMHQLMPAFMYVLAMRFSDIRFSLNKTDQLVDQ